MPGFMLPQEWRRGKDVACKEHPSPRSVMSVKTDIQKLWIVKTGFPISREWHEGKSAACNEHLSTQCVMPVKTGIQVIIPGFMLPKEW